MQVSRRGAILNSLREECSAAYNFKMRKCSILAGILLTVLFRAALFGQTAPEQLTITTKDLPAASLWTPYGEKRGSGVRLNVEGGVKPYHWRAVNGGLPPGLKLDEAGEISGMPQESGTFQFTLDVRDSSNQPLEAQKQVTLTVEAPFIAEWEHKANVNGNRIDGSVKVSNRTGRDFDLTFVVLAVNDIGRATAIGYQHFSLKANTRDMPIPFGDSLSTGTYTVNVDVVGEDPVSSRIFRARLVTPKETIAQGP